MSGNTNPIRNPPYAAQSTFFYTDESQLPAPVSGQIPLVANTQYVAYNDDPSGSQKTVTIANELLFPDAGGVSLTSTGLATVIVSYTGTGNFINTTSNFTGFITIESIFISCPNGTLYNLTGVLPIGNEFFPRINHIQAGFFDIDTIGTIDTISYNINSSAYFDCGQGLILDHTFEALISNVRFTEWKNEAGAVQLTFKDSQQSAKLSGCVFGTKSNETVFDITPGILVDEQVNVTSSVFKGTGSIFTTGTSGTITSIANAVSSGTITAAAGTPFGETIFTDTAHGLSEHQIITQSGFVTATQYNGTFEVLEVVDANSYRIHVGFTITDTGSWNSDLIEITSTAHGLADGTGVQITDTDIVDDYDGGAVVFNQTANTYEINRTFNTTSTGNWNTDSLTEADPRVFFGVNTGVKNSKVIAFAEMNGNEGGGATETTITSGAYAQIEVPGTVSNTVSQRFVLTNAAIGEYTYIGQDPLDGELTAVVSGLKSGGTANYRFTISIDGAIPTFATAAYAPLEMKTTKVSTTILKPVDGLANGQTVQVMAAGDGTGDDITVTDFVLEIRG